MSSPVLSVVVPVYNAQAFLSFCLASIELQSFLNWECICVDDGSSDASSSIVQEFTLRDSRFRLIRQTNGGPGAARNSGLKVATGEYFTFIDSDDLVHPQFFHRLLETAKVHNADLAVSDYVRFASDHEFALSTQHPGVLRGRTEVCAHPLLPQMVDWRKFRVHPWGKLYLRRKHGQLRFPDLCGPEDAYASFDIYGQSDRTVFSEMKLYGYRVVDAGLTRSAARFGNYLRGDPQVAVHGETVCREQGVEPTLRKRLTAPYVMRMFAYLNQMSTDSRFSEAQKQELLELAANGFREVKCAIGGEYQFVPPIHYVPYAAVCLRSLKLLKLWQYVRRPLSALRQGDSPRGNDNRE